MTLNELYQSLDSLGFDYGGVDFLSGDTVLEGATLTESVNGDGGLSLSWKSDVPTCIPAGTECCGFIMMEPYAPSLSSDGVYQHSPKFSDRSALLGKTLFYKTIKIMRGNVEEDIPLYTFSFYGPASEIISALNACADGFSVGGSVLGEDSIFVSFDGDTVKSAAQKIADACDCEVLYSSSGLTIGHAGNYAGEYYNRFVVLGGTKNLAKATSKGMYAAITQRLTLDPSLYPGSIISTGGGTPMMKMLIFDDIYPKMELKISSVRYRECWLFDENGEKIPDGAGGAYKTYRKYYIKLAYTDDDSQYFLDTRNIIQDKVLGIVFQAGSLAGREFELTYFAASVLEHDSKEDLGEGVTTEVGEFRIICQAVNEYLLPSAEFAPTAGQIVTLTNVRLDDHFTDIARAELLSRGQEYAAMYNGGGSLSHSEERVFPDFLTGGGGSTPVAPSGQSVTSVTTDLITGTQTVQYGTFQPKGKLASMADKIEGVSTGGRGTVAEEEDDYVPAQIGNDNLKVLLEAGCNTGIRTVNTTINNITTELESIGADVTEIQSQADQKMQLWFGTYVPTASNYPANLWLTDAEKQLHVEDVFYNYNREANNPNGGKAWRWTRHETQTEIEGETVTTVTYSWELITDADTVQALEKIADVAYDGKLAGGSEKVRVYTEWQKAVEEHAKFNDSSLNYDSTLLTAYNTAYRNLAQTLNGGSGTDIEIERIMLGTASPGLLSDLTATDDILFGYSFINSVNNTYHWWKDDNQNDIEFRDSDDLEDVSRELYRKIWTEYYTNAELLDKASKVTVANLADDGIISAGSEKSLLYTLWGETLAEFWKYLEQAEDYGLESESSNNVYRPYVSAFCNLAWMMNDDTDDNYNYENLLTGDKFVKDSAPDVMKGSSYPKWISDGTNGTLDEDTVIDADDYRSNWQDYYTAKAALLKRIEAVAKAMTDAAQADATTALALIDDMGSDGKLDPSEKLTVKREFVASWNEKDKSEGIIDKCYDDSDHLLIGSSTFEAYINAFVALGTYLNGGTDWTAGLSMRNDTYRATDGNLPSWIQSGNMSTTNNITGSIWRTKWSDFYAARTAVLTALSAYAQSTAESAHERLDDMASDLRITPDEKKELRRQWQSWVSEYGILLNATSSATISADDAWGAYLTALYRLGHYLKDLSDSSAEIENLAEFEVTMLITSGTTDLTQAQATLYNTVLDGFRTARTSLLTALSTGKLNYWVSPFLPTSGFYVGDRCVWKDHLADGSYARGTDTTMICVKQYDQSYVYSQTSETASASTDGTWQDYWKEASTVIGEIEHDPRHQLAALADRLYTLYGGDSGHFPIGIQLTDNGNSVTLSSGTYSSDDAVDSCLEQIRGIIGNESFSVRLSAVLSPVRYDMLCVPVSCTIPGSNGESVTGGIQIKMWNGTAWEYIQESTSSLLESLGNKILAMVFGSNAAATEAAGLTVGQRFAKLFAMAQVWDSSANNGQGGYVTLSQALFGLSVQPSHYQHVTNGTVITAAAYDELSASEKANYAVYDYESSGLLSADKINFTASNNFTTAVGNAARGLKMVMATEGQNSTFTLGYYYDNNGTQTLKNVLSFNSNGKLELTADNTTINASAIDFSGKTITLTASTTLTFKGGTIDFTGTNISMNAANITLNGSPSQSFQSAVAASGVVLKTDMAQFGLYDSNGTLVSGVTALLVNSSTGVPTTTLNLSGNNVNIDAGRLKIYTTTVDEQTGESTTTETAVFSGGKIRASLIDVGNLNVLGALTGQTIDMEDATFENLHVTGEVTGIVTAEQLFQNLNIDQATENYKLTMDNGDEVLVSETNITTLQGYIGEVWDHVGENQDIPRTVVKVEYYGNQNTDIFYVGSSGQRIYIPNPELSEGRTLEIYNGTGGSFIVASSNAPACTSGSETWGSSRSNLFIYATRSTAVAGDITASAVYMKVHAGRRVESGSSVEMLYWIILEQRNADGTIYFP